MTRRRTIVLAAAAIAAVVALAIAVALDGSGDDGAKSPTDGATTVPVPGGGNITETVAPGPAAKTRNAPAPDRAVSVAGGLKVRIADTSTAKVKPGGPGEVGGNAVIVKVRIANDSDEAASLDGVVVMLIYGDNQVAQPLTSDPYRPFSGLLQPGKRADGTYVFRVPKKQSSQVTIVVQPTVGGDVARFGDE